MQKLIETLKSFGIEIPADKQADVKKALSEHYKNTAEHNKAISKLEADRDAWKEKAESAEETLKGFEGIDPAQVQSQLAEYKKKAEDAEKDRDAKLYERDFNDALAKELFGVKFTSEAAKKSVMADIKEAGLKLKDGKILGLNDLISQMKEKDASAFVDEKQEELEAGRAKPFTMPLNGKQPMTSSEKFKAMSLDERMKLKASDPAAYERMRKGE